MQRDNEPLPRQPQSTANAAIEGASTAMSEIASVVRQARFGVASFRTSVRSTPLIMSAVLLTAGYMIGSLTEAWSRRSR